MTKTRSCDGCTLCCKMFAIRELEKPMGQWCTHCDRGKGCRIYAQRPQECRAFQCGFLQLTSLSEAWRPSKCKFVLASELDDRRLVANVDPGFPTAWREEPYYSGLKRWAIQGAPHMRQIVVKIGRRAIVILPHRDVDLGIIADDELIVAYEQRLPDGSIRPGALKMHQDDPRLAELQQRSGASSER